MADRLIFNHNFNLDVASDVSIDFSAAQGYSGFSGNEPWQARIVVNGATNSARGGAGAITDNISVIGACGQLPAGTHNVQVIWFGTQYITLSGAVLRILITKR